MLPRSRCALGLVFSFAFLSRLVESFEVFGYIPEYRFPGADWDGIVERTTHLLLFSAEPTADGDIAEMDRFWLLRKPGSGLRKALKKAGDAAPKILLSIGGAGRSEHFPQVANNKKARHKFARRIVKVMVENPVLAGVDLDWEAPQSADQWRDYAKLVAEIRAAFNSSTLVEPMLTMSYHPTGGDKAGAVGALGTLKSKETGIPFALHFDYCHAMAYSLYDQEKRHSTQRLAKLTVDEWAKAKLPLGRLTLGLPFYGISRISGQPDTYGSILDREPDLKYKLNVDESTNGSFYFNNAETLAKKVRYAAKRKLGGVMIWELGQDKAASNPTGGSLLRHVWSAVEEVLANSTAGASRRAARAAAKQHSIGFLGELLDFNPFTEENIIAGLSGLIGVYMFFKAVLWNVPVRERAPWGPEGPPVPKPYDEDAAAADEDAGEDAQAEGKPTEGEKSTDTPAEAKEAAGEGAPESEG